MAVAVQKTPARRARKPKQAQPEQLSIVMPGGRTLSGARVDHARSDQFSAVYRARSILSQSIASLEIEIRRKEISKGKIRRPLVPDHRLLDLLGETPNNEQTPYTWKEFIGLSLTGWGNSYTVIQSKSGGPEALWHLNPSRVTVERNLGTNELQYRYSDPAGGMKTYFAWEVLHSLLPGDGIVGKSPLRLAREAIGLGLATEATGATLFGNGIMPSAIITHPGKLSTESKKNFEEYFQRFTGPGNQRRFLLMQDGTEYKQMGIPPEDAQFLSTREFQIDEIARWYGVPPHMLGRVKDSKYASITPLQIEFVIYTLKHYALRIAQELTRKLLPKDSGLFIRFDIDDLMRGDFEAQAKWFRELWGIGVFSTNDVLERLDLDDIGEVGDKRAVPVNFTTLEKLGEEPVKPAAGGPGDGGDQATPENGSPRKGLAIVFRDAAGRMVQREVRSLRKLLKQYKADGALDVAICEFFGKHEADVRQAFEPVWCGFAAILGRKSEPAPVVSRYVSSAREVVLQTLRRAGRATLEQVIEAWSTTRADQVTQEYMEAAFLN